MMVEFFQESVPGWASVVVAYCAGLAEKSALFSAPMKNLNVRRIFSYSLEVFIDFSCQRGPSRVMICKALFMSGSSNC